MEYVINKAVDITSEAHLEKFVLQNWDEIFTPILSYVAKRVKVSSRSIVDIIAIDKETKETVVIELKFRPIRNSDKKQLRRYKKDLKASRGIFVGYDRMSRRIEVNT